jgi:hypothetical protein
MFWEIAIHENLYQTKTRLMKQNGLSGFFKKRKSAWINQSVCPLVEKPKRNARSSPPWRECEE